MPGNPLAPSSRSVCVFFGKSSNGVESLILKRCEASLSQWCMCAELAPGPSPPSSNGFEKSTTTLPGSKVHRLPRPEQVSHAPYGLLKENERGSSWGTLVPHSVQASFCE